MTKLERIATEKKVLEQIAGLRDWMIDNGIEMNGNRCMISFNGEGYLSLNVYSDTEDENGRLPDILHASVVKSEDGKSFCSWNCPSGNSRHYFEDIKEGEF